MISGAVLMTNGKGSEINKKTDEHHDFADEMPS